MKKITVILLSILFVLSLTGLVACGEKETPTPTPQMKLTVRTEDRLELNVGDMYKIAYSVSGTTKGVTFTSSNEDVLGVDDFGNLTPKAKGEATVTVALIENPSIKSSITVNVAKTFFYDKVGYKNGGIDFTYEDDGLVQITGGQTQLLVTECGEYWYFKVNLEHTGEYTNYDAQGRYGVGSFYVTDAVPIGEVMAWFGFKPARINKRTFIPYVGGWRVKTNGQDDELLMLESGEVLDCFDEEHGATFELIRYGTMHYATVSAGGKVAKYAYDCPTLEGKPTYPGVYSQEQKINVWDFEASTDNEYILEKLNNFEVAESVEINGLSDTLFAGESYTLTSNVLPLTTFNKTVTYSLESSVSGVSITNDVLTIGDEFTGTITVVATSNSNDEVTASKTFTVVKKQQSQSTVLDTGALVGTATLDNDAISVNGTAYVPLLTKGNVWGVSFKLSNLSTSGKVGLLASKNGYFDYVDFAFSLNGSNRKVSYGTLNSDYNTFAYLSDGANLSNVDVEILKSNDNYYISVNGTLVKKLTLNANLGELTPVLYADGAQADFADIGLLNSEETTIKINSYAFATGAFVTVTTEGKYILSQKDFGSATNINWPPVNDYENGLKSTKTFTGNFEIEFTVSDIKPMAKNGAYDSKLLVYLRSENTTASIQFVIKGSPSKPTVALCPNLDDATWNEYPITDVDLLEGSHTIKVVKKSGVVELYIDGNRSFEGNSGLSNNGYWSSSTVFTPGVSTFLCGATLSDVKFTEVK